ncbi:MAG: hypothetical protein LBL80_04595 [Ruminococcus sp.]|jgi:hypothetical protein|nr:hypothetical protein [Ruminococcus sp.]
MKTRNNFDVPVFEYYDNGGKYSGNRRDEKKDDFNYKTEIVKTDDGKYITADVWYGLLSYDCSEKIAGEQFSADKDGLSKAYEFIDSCYDKWLQNHEPIIYVSEYGDDDDEFDE